MEKTVVLNVVGLMPVFLDGAMPCLSAFARQGKQATIKPVLPAVTCSVQTTFLTGRNPNEHGIVGNGWYWRDTCEVRFWQQSNKLIQCPQIWETARALDPSFTCANLFWWFNMYSSVDYAVTPRPLYLADGRKIPDIYTKPMDLRFTLQKELGQFPLFRFWGPGTSIASSAWITEAAKMIDRRYDPTLTLIYLPHLDYCLQCSGPVLSAISQDMAELDALCGELINYYRARHTRVIVLSEYGMTAVTQPIHVNRELRKRGMIALRQERGRDVLDVGASVAFAVADHQVAHVYVNDSTRLDEVYELLRSIPGVAQVLNCEEKGVAYLDHSRSGDLIALAEADAWFTYYYWLDDRRAPDYARTVDIHRKPGYDPVELFFDPRFNMPQLKVASTQIKARLGFRSLLDIIPLDASLVRGSHGRVSTSEAYSPVCLIQEPDLLPSPTIEAKDVYTLLLKHIFPALAPDEELKSFPLSGT